MKAHEMRAAFLAPADWVDADNTVDRIIVGDPDKDIHRVLVTWMPSFAAVRAAVEGGYDMLLGHEPTFWRHLDEIEHRAETPTGVEKLKYIEAHGLVVMRNHDVWDRMPEIGIPWAWARFLDMGDRPVTFGRNGYQHRYDVEPTTLEALAQRIAAKTATIGEPMVQVTGDPQQQVSRVGIGTGCGCETAVFQEMGCDVSIVCDDGSCYWANIQLAKDMGHPVVRVNHGTSEEPGMVTLTQYINDTFEGVTADHLPHGSCFRLIGA